MITGSIETKKRNPISTEGSRFPLNHDLLSRMVFVLFLVVTLRIFFDLNDCRKRGLQCKYDLKSQVHEHKIDLGIKVSVIVPTLNEAETLPNLLRSISTQTYSNIEVVVVDSMSQDGTSLVAEKFGANVICASVKSIGYASDVGARASSGQIIVRCDADTIFTPRHVEKVVTKLSCSNAKVLHCGHWYYDGVFLDNFLAFLYDKYWRQLHKTSGTMTAIRREAYLDLGGYDRGMKQGEDFDLGSRVLAKYGPEGIIYDYKSLVTPISARAIRKYGRFQYLISSARSFTSS